MQLSVIAFEPGNGGSATRSQQGTEIAIAGRAKLSHWTRKDGEFKSAVPVVADHVLSAYQVQQRRAKAHAGSEVNEIV